MSGLQSLGVLMIGSEQAKSLREQCIKHLEAALAITDEIGDTASGLAIERALELVRADTWPGS